MKRFLLLLLVGWTGITMAQTIQYGSFNVRYANGDRGTRNDWKNRRDTLASFVRHADLSICGMQEVLHEQLLDLQRLLPEYDYVGVGRDDGRTEGEYSPIFFRRSEWRAVESGTFWLSETPDSVGSHGWDAVLPRIATWVLLERREAVKHGRGRKSKGSPTRLICVSTHFDHIGVEARVESGRLILRKVREIAGELPLVLTGDFNVGMESSVYQSIMHDPDYPLLDSYLLGAPHEGCYYTYHDFARKPQAQCPKIDFIFVSPNIKVTRTRIPAEGRNPGDVLMSDHNPVIVELKIEN